MKKFPMFGFRPVACLAGMAILSSVAVTAAPRKVVLVTATKGFRHSSIPTAENVIRTLGETTGDFTVVDVVRGGPDGKDDAEVAAKLTLDKLADVDAVIFANTTGDLAIPDKDGFMKWIEEGHALIGMHSASDTFHGYRPFVEMLGGEFLTHGAQVTVECYNQDPSHAACASFGSSYTVYDEIYEFKSFDRSKVHGLLTLDKHPQNKMPGDYPVAWCKNVGQGRMFYTSLGHREDVWTSSPFQKHIRGGVAWALGMGQGSGVPTDTAAALSDIERAAGFKLLFDGKTMDGWVYRREDGKRSWSVQNGMLVNTLGKDEHGTDLYTAGKYRDFILRCEYQVPPNSNSGLYLRGRHEIQILSEDFKGAHDKGFNGDIYNVASCTIRAPRAPGQWQQIEARMIGDRITVILNGVKVHDNVLCDKGTGSHLDENVKEPGPILLQGDHGAVAFRNMRIKSLNSP